MWRRRKSSEPRPPWYRAPDYRGNLTEAEKRELDTFRARLRHPAFEYGDLPEHVEMYISGLELETYDLKQARAAARAVVCSLAGAALLYVNHFGFTPRHSIWEYIFGIALLVAPWIAYRSEWRKNSDSFGPASEGIRKEWELDYIAKAHLAAKHFPHDPPDLRFDS
jgi:hypothetical protein